MTTIRKRVSFIKNKTCNFKSDKDTFSHNNVVINKLITSFQHYLKQSNFLDCGNYPKNKDRFIEIAKTIILKPLNKEL